jgi:large subunit ribosomal protein L47
MRAIKLVMNERRLAYEGAVELAEKQRTEQLDAELLRHEKARYKAEQKELLINKRFIQRHIAHGRRKLKKEAEASAGGSTVAEIVPVPESTARPQVEGMPT